MSTILSVYSIVDIKFGAHILTKAQNVEVDIGSPRYIFTINAPIIIHVMHDVVSNLLLTKEKSL